MDFALLAFEPVDSDLESFPILQDELVLIMSPDDPLAKRESLKIEELGEQSFVAHNVKTASRHKVVEAFEQHHTPLNITLELATVETIKRFVQLKIGLAFVPRMCVAEELERGTLVTVPVPELSYFRTLWVTHRRNITLSHCAAAFLEVLRQHARGRLRRWDSRQSIAAQIEVGKAYLCRAAGIPPSCRWSERSVLKSGMPTAARPPSAIYPLIKIMVLTCPELVSRMIRFETQS